jgi:hypothetical protein
MEIDFVVVGALGHDSNKGSRYRLYKGESIA